MAYAGIGLKHPLEVEGQVFISNTETTNVPLEIYSNYSDKYSLIDSRQLRLRVIPSELPGSTSHIDMGIDNTTGNSFYISQPVYDSTVTGNKDTFKIDNQGNVSVNVKNYNADDIYGNLVSSSNMIIDESSIVTSNLTISTGLSFNFNYSNVLPPSEALSVAEVNMQVHQSGLITYRSAIILTTEGSIYGCGYNIKGQLGTGDKVSTKFFVRAVGEGTSNVTKIRRNKDCTVILKNNGKVYVSGAGPSNTGGVVFTEITSITDVIDVRITDGFFNYYLFLKSDGSVYGLGSNPHRAMGIGDLEYANTPTLLINGASQVSAISVGYFTSSIIKNNAVYTCGQNYEGILGISSVPLNTTITTHQITDGEGSSGVDQVEFHAGGFALHIRKSDAIYSTGRNIVGELGTGPGPDQTTFTAAINEGASGVTNLFDGGAILKTDDRIYYTGPAQNYVTYREYTQNDFNGPVTYWNALAGLSSEAIISDSNVLVKNYTPFFGLSYTNTFTDVSSGFILNDDDIAEINNTIHGNPVIKFNSIGYQDDYGAIVGLHETASSNVLRMGVLTTNSTNYVTVNEGGTMSATRYLSFQGMHGGISSNVIEKDLIVSVDPSLSPIIYSANDVLTNVKLSDIKNDPNVFGVSNGDGHYNAVGNGTVWVTDENGTFTSGDYITSSTLSGYGVKQDDDTQMNYTVAKILQNCDFANSTRFIVKFKDKTLTTAVKPNFINPKNVCRAEVVACTYHCG